MKAMYIYELIDPRNSKVRYIGKSNKPELRFQQHWAEGYNPEKIYLNGILTMTYKKIWIIDLRMDETPPILNVLEQCGNNWRSREAWWIAYYESRDYILVNGKETGRSMRRWNGKGYRRKTNNLAPIWIKNICYNIDFEALGY